MEDVEQVTLWLIGALSFLAGVLLEAVAVVLRTLAAHFEEVSLALASIAAVILLVTITWQVLRALHRFFTSAASAFTERTGNLLEEWTEAASDLVSEALDRLFEGLVGFLASAASFLLQILAAVVGFLWGASTFLLWLLLYLVVAGLAGLGVVSAERLEPIRARLGQQPEERRRRERARDGWQERGPSGADGEHPYRRALRFFDLEEGAFDKRTLDTRLRELRVKLHPDQKGSTYLFQELEEAYRTICRHKGWA